MYAGWLVLFVGEVTWIDTEADKAHHFVLKSSSFNFLCSFSDLIMIHHPRYLEGVWGHVFKPDQLCLLLFAFPKIIALFIFVGFKFSVADPDQYLQVLGLLCLDSFFSVRVYVWYPHSRMRTTRDLYNLYISLAITAVAITIQCSLMPYVERVAPKYLKCFKLLSSCRPLLLSLLVSILLPLTLCKVLQFTVAAYH